MSTIGVLAFQGAVEKHRPHIEAAGLRYISVKSSEELNQSDALIMPGGESSTMLKLINTFEMWSPLADYIKDRPVWGICAGSILLAKTVSNPQQKSFEAIPLTAKRNGYGRQLDSSDYHVNGYPVSFIRAPIFQDIPDDCEVLHSWAQGPTWIDYHNIMVTSFHPELTDKYPSPMHMKFFEKLIKK